MRRWFVLALAFVTLFAMGRAKLLGGLASLHPVAVATLPIVAKRPQTLILSPHLDDGVLSCGEMIQHCQNDNEEIVVATVFAGPEMNREVQQRRIEDVNASRVLGHKFAWGELPENALRGGAPLDPGLIRETIEPWIGLADVVFAPLGLQHPDHIVVADVAWQVAQRLEKRLVVYEELPYRVEIPMEAFARITRLKLPSIADNDVPPRADLDRKIEAVQRYTTQVPILDLHSCFVRERFWRLRMQDWL